MTDNGRMGGSPTTAYSKGELSKCLLLTRRKTPVEESTEFVSGTPPPVLPDPFDAKALRLPPAFEQNAGIRKVISTIPVRKPHSQEWIRVHPGEDFSGNFGVIILKDDNEFYLLHPNLVGAYENEMTRVRIFTCMSMNKIFVLVGGEVAGSGHKNADRWNNSAIEAAEAAMKRKVRVQSNKGLGAYEYSSPTILRRRMIRCGPTI